MLEIIILFFLTKNIGVLAASKGLPARRWKVRLVLAWILAELTGAVIAVIIFGKDDLFSCLLVAIGCAFSANYLVKNYLSKLPDVIGEEDINNIGR